MAQRKPYNPSTRYGRKKIREQYSKDIQNMTPEEKESHTLYMIIAVIVIMVILWAVLGTDGFLKWASH